LNSYDGVNTCEIREHGVRVVFGEFQNVRQVC
jgi:hypothetical protein